MLVRRACPELDSGITNSIRPVVTARLLGNGEAQTIEKSLSSCKRGLKFRNSSLPSPNPSHQERGKNDPSPLMGEVRWRC